MHLKNLEIDGFKSFNEKVKINFDSGITSIVGPNGSGKSNILDSILWVLGEQSYKNIRAKNSSDVIFSGGGQNKSRSSAEVSLFIDNSDRTLMIDSDDVVVSRKITSKGENQYKINKEKVRLKDITELFMDTGIGKAAYSVIGQGKVERIISSSAKEIRSIIEEAASIKKIKLRKSEAVKKLEKVENEIEKISFVEKELLTNVKNLEKQAEKATKYIEIKDKVDKLKKYYYSKDFEETTFEYEILKKEEQDLKKIIEEKQSVFEKNENRLEEINKKREGLNDLIEKTVKSNEEKKNFINDITNNKTLYSERIEAYKREKKELDNRYEKDQLKLEEKKDKVLKLFTEIENLEKELKEKKVLKLSFQDEILEKKSKLDEFEIELKTLREKVINCEIEKVKFVNEFENSEKRIKSIKKRKEELNNQKNKALEIQNEIFNKISKIETKLSLKKSGIDMLDEELEIINNNKFELEKKVEQAKKELNFCEKILSRIKIKYLNLKKMDENNEGFFKGVKEVLNSDIKGVIGPIVSLIEIPEKYEKAIEIGIGNSMQDIIVGSSEVAKKCINYLKNNNYGRATFIPFDTIKNIKKTNIDFKNDKIIGYACDLVKYNSEIQSAINLVLGKILVVEDIDTGIKVLKQKIHKGNIITLDGQLLSGSGKMSGGQYLKSNSGLILERKRELKKLEIEYNEADSDYKKLEEKYNRVISEQYQNENSLNNKLKLKKEFNEELEKEKLQKNNIKLELIQIEKNISVIEFEETELKENFDEYQNMQSKSEEQKFRIEKLIKDLQILITEKNTKYEENKKVILDVEKENSEKQLEILSKSEKLKQLKDLYLQNNLEMKNLKKEVENINQKEEELLNLIEETTYKLEEINKNFKVQNLEYSNIKEELEGNKKFQKQLEESEKSLINSVRIIEKEIIQLETKYTRILEKKEKNKSKLEYLEEKLMELNEIKKVIFDYSLVEAKQNLTNAEIDIKSLGMVNLLSIEEYKGMKKRHDFLKNQKDDLIGSKESLKKLILEIENNIKNNFYDAYKQINKNFNYMCKEILNNSIGNLKLLDENNILESGIELIVKFKNKKSQSLSLLSGGEKSMVAVALIMAIFMYKPSPFTFFDEIEAALDDLNTKRLIRKLKEFTDKSQFILITHNKQTMKESDILYGVTMDKKIGESKVLSVKL